MEHPQDGTLLPWRERMPSDFEAVLATNPTPGGLSMVLSEIAPRHVVSTEVHLVEGARGRGHQNRKSEPIKAIQIKAIPGRCLQYSLALERLKSHGAGRLMSVRAERTWNFRHTERDSVRPQRFCVIRRPRVVDNI